MKYIPEAILCRLPVYYRHVRIIAAEGKKITTSTKIAERVGNTATQVRQDIYTCGGTENYHVDNLQKWFSTILSINEEHHMIVIGAGNLGRAIISNREFEDDGFFIDAAFDSNPLYEGMSINGIPILNINFLESYLMENSVDIAVLTIPSESAQKIADILIECGIKGIWNFAPCELKASDKCVIRSIHLADSLMTLSLRMNLKK